MTTRHSVCTLNVRGMATKACLGTKVSHIQHSLKKIKIILIQETNTSQESCTFLAETVGAASCWTRHVGIIITDNKLTLSEHIALADERIILARITCPNLEEFWVGSVYAPADPTENRLFWEMAAEIPWPANLILGGDHNTWINGAVDRWPATARTPISARSFANFLIKTKLIDIGSPLTDPIRSITRWEFAYRDQVKVPISGTRIDKILVTAN